MKKTAIPAFQFYPGDWRKDENLSRCSLAAKGALVEILCLAFQCEKKGKLMTDGNPWSMDDICMAIGGDFSATRSAVEELLTKKVLKKDKKGCIFSSRMVRDEQVRKVRAEGGKRGASHGFKGKDFGKLGGRGVKKPPLEPPIKHPPSSSSSSSTSVIKKIQNNKDAAEPLVFPPGFPEAVWTRWIEYKSVQHKFRYKAIGSEQTALNKSWKDAGCDAGILSEMVDTAIANGWKGLFRTEKSSTPLFSLEDNRKKLALR